MKDHPHDPATDLRLERVVDVPVELVWKAWTTPELIVQWFCPRPWGVSECVLDLQPGGRFFTLIRSPENDAYPNESCVLEVIEGRRLVWTDSLHAGFRPAPRALEHPAGVEINYTVVVSLLPEGKGTRYISQILHANAAARDEHVGQGFEAGWGAALDQLAELLHTGRGA
ncbi:MAG: SRPBCC family protein [Steroidobacteraceae bacterium]